MSSPAHQKPCRRLRTPSDFFPYQPTAIDRMVAVRKSLVLLKMGLGKTIITLSALVRLGCRRVVVFAPASIVEGDVWGEEARAWTHTQGVEVVPVLGGPQHRLDALMSARSKSVGIYVISYENVDWLLDQDAFDLTEFDAVVFDEVSKMKTPGTKRFKRLRSRVVQVPVVFGLTGTPVGNHLIDLWGETFITVGPEPFGSHYGKWRLEYFVPLDYEQRTWGPQYMTPERLMAKLKPFAFSLDAKLAAGRLPEVRVNAIDVTLPPNVIQTETKLAASMRLQLEDGTDLAVLSASAQAMKVRQLASGAVYTDPLDESKWSVVHTAKLDRLVEMVEEMQGEPVIIWYWFQHERERILKALKTARCKDDFKPGEMAREWNARKIEQLVLHPGSAGHGLNLQFGGSQSIWYTLPWSGEMWQQANGRQARPGQPDPYCTANVLLAGEADYAVLSILTTKLDVEAGVLDGLKLITMEDLEDIL